MTRQTPYAAADGLVRVYPAAEPSGAGLVWAHGGGFVAGDLDMPEADWVARAFAAHGIPVVSIDYRLVGDGSGRFPAGSDDVLTAWTWTLDHADELGIDPGRLAIGGASAGANLVTGAVLRLLGHAVDGGRGAGAGSVAGRVASASERIETEGGFDSLNHRNEGGFDGLNHRNEGGFDRLNHRAEEGGFDRLNHRMTAELHHRRPAGVFLAYPTLLAVQPAPGPELRAALDADPDADRFRPDRVREMYETYLGGPVDDAPLVAVPGLAEPSDLAGFPPTVMVNGDTDELRVSGEAFAATLLAAGVPVELALEPGTWHGHLNRPDEPGASATVARVAAWIHRGFTAPTTT